VAEWRGWKEAEDVGQQTTYLQQNRKYISTTLLNVSYNAVFQHNIPQGKKTYGQY